MKMPSRWCSVLFGVVAILFLAAAFWPRSAVRTDTRNQPREAKGQLSGDKARDYLEQTGDGQSLMKALTAARFGLEWRERGPAALDGADGYLGMSHEQNLNAWFGADGVTVRPTLPEEKRAQAWSMALRLKAFGYGKQLVDAPPVVSRQVKDNRIEYQRGDQKFATANPSSGGSEVGGQTVPELVEWFENRAEGVEQGFTINKRPKLNGEVAANEPLRVLLAVTGDLRARVKDDGQQIELVDEKSKAALSYSKLVAMDAEGKKLTARMEASADGREIGLVVEDGSARYPIVIDPVMASLEKKLEAFAAQQLDARFGFAVAIDGDRAVVGAWREDSGATVDIGVVYFFTRSGSTWTFISRNSTGNFANDGCGWSVAISDTSNGTGMVYGCPGANGGAGRAFLVNVPTGRLAELIPPSGTRDAGDRFGASVAISGDNIVVGAPFHGSADIGAAFFFTVGPNLIVTGAGFAFGSNNNDQLGTSVGADSNTFIAGAPGVGAGRAYIFVPSVSSNRVTLQPSDGATDDQFGSSVAISGNTAVVGAPVNRDRGADAGAAYVFVRDTNGNWSQQQKLLGSDAFDPSDFFGAEKSVAIQGNTIVVGAYGWEPTNNINDEYGKAYIFMRSGTVWTEQATMVGDNHSPDQFGIATSISGDTVLIGANVATASGVGRAGAAYVYRLPHTLGNISTRLRVETGDNVLIGGFIITGTQTKKIIVRAIGPSLPFADILADPTLELYQGNTLLEANDNWVDSPNKQAIIDSTIPPTNNLESAIVRTLAPGAYTAIVRGVNNGSGIGLVEAYDLDISPNSKLANISTRGLVQTGDNVLIAGTIVVGEASQKVIIRALGPSVPVPGRLGDPTLELHDSNGTLLEANDNWKDSPNKQAIIDSTIPPTNDLESAIVRTLPLGNYTAIVRGVGGTPGIAVVEVYALN